MPDDRWLTTYGEWERLHLAPERKTDAERALLDTQNTTELAALHRWRKIGSVPSHTFAAVGSDGTEPTTRPRPASSPPVGTAWGEPDDDPLAGARGCYNAMLLSIPFWVAAALGAWAAWRWWTG